MSSRHGNLQNVACKTRRGFNTVNDYVFVYLCSRWTDEEDERTEVGYVYLDWAQYTQCGFSKFRLALHMSASELTPCPQP